jgi:hypothetical protein
MIVAPGATVVVVPGFVTGFLVVVVVVGCVVVVVPPAAVVVVVPPAAVVVVVPPAAVVVVVAAEQVGIVIVLASSVTEAFCANTRPITLAPENNCADVNASIVPWNEDPVPSVAELVTCQKTLHADASPIRTTELFDAVVNVEPA